MKIGSFLLNKGRTFVIAEIGGNHEGDFNLAKHMIHEAARAGADAVKFQALRADDIVNVNASQPAYSGVSHKKQWERFKKIEFTHAQYEVLKLEADRAGVVFLASVFDEEVCSSIRHLLPAYKVASGDLTYMTLLNAIKRSKKPLLLSTGAATLTEIQNAVRLFGKRNLALLHCICAYPAPHEEANLKTIPFLIKKFGIPIGYSDHTLGIECCLAAVALGACIIEKHFTLNPEITMGDHKHSATPDDFKHMTHAIRVIEKSLGKPRKNPFLCEKKARPLVRRSFYASRDLNKGDILNATNISALRPLSGISVEAEAYVRGKTLRRPIKTASPIQWSDLNRKMRNKRIAK